MWRDLIRDFAGKNDFGMLEHITVRVKTFLLTSSITIWFFLMPTKLLTWLIS